MRSCSSAVVAPATLPTWSGRPRLASTAPSTGASTRPVMGTVTICSGMLLASRQDRRHATQLAGDVVQASGDRAERVGGRPERADQGGRPRANRTRLFLDG